MPRLPKNGVLVASILLLAGVASAGIAWWNTRIHTRHALDYWGPRAAVLIRDAPRVAAFRVEFSRVAATGAGEHELSHPATGAAAHVLDDRDISQAKGLLHLRHALLDDRSFAWDEQPSGPGALAHALVFREGEARVVAYFSDDFTRMTAIRAGGKVDTVSTRPISKGLATYFADVLPQ